ncbi:MAG: HupE/UreJ family protein [Desulfurivibrionaceae bacterium]
MNLRKSGVIAVTAFLMLLPSLAAAHGISEGDKVAMLDGGLFRYLWLGASHMLTGYDHLLFLFGVIFFLTGFRDILKYITAFTLGHSLTLVAATLLGVSVNYYLIDAAIALSVCYKGFENLGGFRTYLGRRSPNLLWIIFGFGLIHGFGLSTRLQQLPLGDEGLLSRILSFNVGVELGQVAALAVMLLIISGWRRTRSFNRFATASNRGLVVAGVLLFLVQMHGFGHTTDLNLFGFGSTVGPGGMPHSGRGPNMAQAVESDHLREALDGYDQAFRARDVDALWQIFAKDMVLYEQGSQNVGREEALLKHLGPDLQAFRQMEADFTDARILESGNTAIVTRRLAVKGILPDRYFLAQGHETQGWALRDGKWRLVHLHWSFPSG